MPEPAPIFVALSTFYFVTSVVICVVMIIIVPRQRHSGTAVAWLLVIFSQPIIGLILYWLIGCNRLAGRRIRRYREAVVSIGDSIRVHQRLIPHSENLPEQFQSQIVLCERLGRLPVVGGNKAELLADTDDVIDRLVADIDAAKHHVHLLFYIYADDATGRRVAEALAEAEKRGVECRVLMDGVGSAKTFKKLVPKMRGDGIEVHEMLEVGLFRQHMSRIDLRNHRKVAVIDGLIAYTGSQNIVDADYGSKDLVWDDLMLRVEGSAALQLQAVFVADWYVETEILLQTEDIFPEPKPVGNTDLQTLPSGPVYAVENYQRLTVSALHAARERVVITTPYFVPDEAFMQALEVAVLRGVEVTVVVPKQYDQLLVGAASRAYYEELLASGIKLYLFQEGVVHAKTISVDGMIGMIGSSNFDVRSFTLNFEVNMIMYGAEIGEALYKEQCRYVELSKELTKDIWEQRSFGHHIVQHIAKLFSPLL